MLRKKLPLVIVLAFIPFLMKAEWIPLNNNTKQSAPNVTLVSSDNNSTVLKIEISGFNLKNINAKGKEYQVVDLLTESFVAKPGMPALPYIAKTLAIPDQAAISFEVLQTSEIQTFNNIHLSPARESWKEGDPETPYIENYATYSVDDIFPNQIVNIDPPAIFRDFRIARISVYPITYNPAKKELKVATSLIVKINYGPGEVTNPKTTVKKPIAPSFGQLYKSFIFNYQEVLDDNYGGKENGHELMLCIMPDDFYASFQTYAEWKRESGIDIHITKFSDIGANSTDPDIIKTHIADAYHNWEVPPTYILLVGDDGIVPKKIINYDYSFPYEDYFVEIDGDDYFPEMMIGRFTNQSEYTLQVMTNKFTLYEKTPYTTTTDWFEKGICCSNDAYPSQVETKRFAAQKMLDYGFTSVDTMMNSSPCNYELPDVIAAINEGRSYLNYRGEGWSSGWWASCTSFGTSDVSSLTNGQKLTFYTSIGCGVAMFSTGGGNCFGEELLESGSLSAPKGAVAFVGPTSNTHTTYNNKLDKGIYTGMFLEGMNTPGQGLARGRLYMYNIFGDTYDVEYHYRVYAILGDPSIHIWKDVPQDVTVDFPASITFGTNMVEFTVENTSSTLPVEGAVVCVTGNDVFVTGTTDATGKAYLEITLEEVETLTVTIRGGTVIPFQGVMNVVPPTGPWVVKDYFTLDDIIGGNGNNEMDYGESILFSLAVKNIGVSDATNVSVELSTSNPYITITDNNHTYPSVLSGQSVMATDAFAFDVTDSIPDGHAVVINVTASMLFNNWNSNLTIVGQAPLLSMGGFSVSDPLGDGNGQIDPGETVTIHTIVDNTGSSLSPSAIASLTSISPYITVNTGSLSLGQIVSDGSASADFEISCSPSTPVGEPVDFSLTVDAGSYGFDTTIYNNVGLLVEDWELGNFTRYPWYHTGDEDWLIIDADPYEGTFTARSGVITDSETTTMRLLLQVDLAGQISFFRKVSSENNYDRLRFYIDDVLLDEWSGNIDWSEVSFDVTAGLHVFRWTYYKDGSASSAEDCVWVDNILFPPSTVVSPEIDLSPGSFNKTVILDGIDNDILSVSNTGSSSLNFTASINFIDNSKNLATVYPSNFSYATGTCTNTSRTEVSLVKGLPPNEVGWMKFDISSIPDGSTINSVEFHGFVNDNNHPYWSITPVTNDPVTADVSVLYADIIAEGSSGYYLHQTEPGTLPVDWITHTLGGNVNTDLENTLVQDWFAIGIMDTDGSSTYYINFDGWNEANVPYLVIDYTLNETWLNIDGGTSVTSSVEPGNTQNINVNFDASTYLEGTYYANIDIISNDQDEQQVEIPCTLTVTHGMQVSLTAFLEGPYNGSAMATDINTVLPSSQPYNIAPWNYNGTEMVSSMPATAVDWVLIELRDATSAASATPATIVEQKAGLLLSDGSIVATNGFTPLSFNSTIINSMFTVIYHRNHLAIMSANSLSESGGIYSYDFTTASNQAYGTNAQKQLADKWGMISGDCDANGTIGIGDIEPEWITNAGKEGYSPVDLNLDQQIDNRDKDDFWLPNEGKGTNVPQ